MSKGNLECHVLTISSTSSQSLNFKWLKSMIGVKTEVFLGCSVINLEISIEI